MIIHKQNRFANAENKTFSAHKVKNPEGKKVIKRRYDNRQMYFYYLLSMHVPVGFNAIIQYIYIVYFIIASYNNCTYHVLWGQFQQSKPVMFRSIWIDFPYRHIFIQILTSMTFNY